MSCSERIRRMDAAPAGMLRHTLQDDIDTVMRMFFICIRE